MNGAIFDAGVGPARIPLLTYLCLITSLVCVFLVHSFGCITSVLLQNNHGLHQFLSSSVRPFVSPAS